MRLCFGQERTTCKYACSSNKFLQNTLSSAIFLHIYSCRRRRLGQPPLTHVKILTESRPYNQFTLRSTDGPATALSPGPSKLRMGQVLPCLLKRELVLPFNTLIPLFAYHHLATLVSWRGLIWANSNPGKMGKIS